jgi:hypothetical protein
VNTGSVRGIVFVVIERKASSRAPANPGFEPLIDWQVLVDAASPTHSLAVLWRQPVTEGDPLSARRIVRPHRLTRNLPFLTPPLISVPLNHGALVNRTSRMLIID